MDRAYKKGDTVIGFSIIGEVSGKRYASTNFKVIECRDAVPFPTYILEPINLLEYPKNAPIRLISSKSDGKWQSKTAEQKEILNKLEKMLDTVEIREDRLKPLYIINGDFNFSDIFSHS